MSLDVQEEPVSVSAESAIPETPSAKSSRPPDMDSWTQAILLAAKQIGVRSSPELVRNAAAWAASADKDQAIIDIAHAAGLTGDFVNIPARKLTAEMLPVLMAVGDSHVGVVTAIEEGKFTLAFAVEDSFIERKIPIDNASRKASLKVLAVAAREQAQDARLETYLRQKPDTWLRHILLKNWSTFLELGSASLFANLIGIATSLFAMQVWDRVVPARSFETLWVLASGVAIALPYPRSSYRA